MKYTYENGVHIVEIPATDVKITMVDTTKKTAAKKNYCNAGFFAGYSENGQDFTLPVGHLVCDYAAGNEWTKHYCKERGRFNGDKFTFDTSKWSYNNPFCGKAISTLIIKNGEASIVDVVSVPVCDYAISGVPIMRGGNDVTFATYVKGQGWGGSSLYATWHIFVGLKADPRTLYVMCAKTTTSNMIRTAEAYKKFKAMGFVDVIKLDGGGSTYFNANGETVSTSENRRINNIISFVDKEETPTTDYEANKNIALPILKSGSKGDSVKALQILLNGFGYSCGIADGDFGAKTLAAVKQFQKVNGLTQNGTADNETWLALLL